MKRLLTIFVALLLLFQAIAIFTLMADLTRRERRLALLEHKLADHEHRIVAAGVAALARQTSPFPAETEALTARIAQLDAELDSALSELNRLSAASDARIPMDLIRASTTTTAFDHQEHMLRAQAKGRSWGAEQASGPPDTDAHGDIPTAWASKEPDAGEEWLELDYEVPVTVEEVNVHESYHPGAISKLAAILPDGSEAVLWEGTMDPPTASPERIESSFPATESTTASRLKIYLDTTRVAGWNEIDAVEVVGADGSRQWASASRASSTYADR